MDLNLTGKIALVVASSKGLGKAIAEQLSVEGADVMLTSRSIEHLEIAKQQLLPTAKGRVECYPCDVTRIDDIQALITESLQNIPLKRFGDPTEFAKVVCFLASGASSCVTGSTIMVDGGMVRGF